MKQRNYGIDFLRILAMFFVVIIHILSYGSIIETAENDTKKLAIAWLLKIIAYCAVNCYALITGFVYFSDEKKPHKFSKYISLWLQVECYSVLITVLFWRLRPDLVDIKQVLKSFLPVATNQYWYFSAYTGVFFIIPWLNRIVPKLRKENFKKYFICLFGFSLYVTFSSLFQVDPFGLNAGLSFLWLAMIYIIGAYIKKYELYHQFSKRKLLLTTIILVLFTWSWKVGIGKLTMELFGKSMATECFISYTSPTILGIAIAVFLLCLNLNIKPFFINIIKFVSPAAFGVYLLHEQPILREVMIVDKYQWIAYLSIGKMLITIIVSAFIIFTAGIFIDRIRIVIFKQLKIDKLSEKLESLINK